MNVIEKACSFCGETIKKGEFVLESSVQEKTFMCIPCAARAKTIIDKSEEKIINIKENIDHI